MPIDDDTQLPDQTDDDGSPSVSSADQGLAVEEAKTRLDKLRLEKALLEKQLSPTSKLGWLKSTAGPVAVITLLWTVLTGYDQMSQTRESREEDRFSKALALLNSNELNERFSGVASLGRFLPDSSGKNLLSLISLSSRRGASERRKAAIENLIQDIVIEQDPTVRASIVNLFDRLEPADLAGEDWNFALVTAVSRSKTLLPLVAKADYPRLVFMVRDEDAANLISIGDAISVFVQKGGHVQDMSKIYCKNCDFAGKKINLSNVNLNRSFLEGADFHDANLTNTSFDGADLAGTNFTNSNLQSAKITDKGDMHPALLRRLNDVSSPFPSFICADLRGAIFEKQVLFGLAAESDTNTSTTWTASFRGSNVAGADFSRFVVFAETLPEPKLANKSISPSYEAPVPFTASKVATLNERTLDGRAITFFNVHDDWKPMKEMPKEFRSGVNSVLNDLAAPSNIAESLLPAGVLQLLPAKPDFDNTQELPEGGCSQEQRN